MWLISSILLATPFLQGPGKESPLNGQIRRVRIALLFAGVGQSRFDYGTDLFPAPEKPPIGQAVSICCMVRGQNNMSRTFSQGSRQSDRPFPQRNVGTATDGQAFPCRTNGQTFFERHLQWDTADYRTGLFGVRGGGGWTDRFRPWWTSLWFVSGERSRLRDRPFLQGGRKERSSIGQTYRGRERGRYLEGSGGRSGRQMNGQTFSMVVCNGTGLLCRCRCRSAVRE